MNKNQKIIFLLDMDAFFAGCHIATNPFLKDKNMVVSSANKRSVVLTSSYNARKFNINAGMPIFKAKELCHDLIMVKPDFALYSKFSNEIFVIIATKFTKKIEINSIDECYIDVTDIWKKYKSVKKLAMAMQFEIFRSTGLTCSIGISTNKFLAKSCVDFNKPNGISFLLPKDVPSVLWPLDIRKMYMVGIATEKIFKLNNINTIGDLAKSNQKFIQNLLGKRGFILHFWANGIASDEVEYDSNELKTISNEFTLNNPSSNINEINEMIYELCLKIQLRANKRFVKGKTVAVTIKYENNDFIYIKPFKKRTSKQETLPSYSNNVETLFSSAKQSFSELWNGDKILLIGIKLSNLIDNINNLNQLSLKDIESNDNGFRKNEINTLLKKIEEKFGSNKVFTASSLLKFNDKNKKQSKYLNNDDIHISNEELIKKWNK